MDTIIDEKTNLTHYLDNLGYYMTKLFEQAEFRSLVFYYEDRTAFIVTFILQLLKSLSHIPNCCLWFMHNLDENFTYSNQSAQDRGKNLLTITVLENVIPTQPALQRLFDVFQVDPRFNHIFVVTKIAGSDVIADFFREIWKHWILNAALISWTNGVRIYSSRPYEQRFLIPAFEQVAPRSPMPTDLFDTIFNHNADNLANTTIKVFVMEDPPKIYRIPARLRFGDAFYFGGRDGRVAREMEKALNARWQYVSPPANFHLFEFPDYNHSSVDVWGHQVPSDYEQMRDIVEPDTSRGQSLA